MNGGDCAIRCVLMTVDALSLFLQLAIFTLIFQATAKKGTYTAMAMIYIIFNPFSMIGGDSHYNLGAFNDCLWYGIIYQSILATRYEINKFKLIALSTIALYFDPRLFFILANVQIL